MDCRWSPVKRRKNEPVAQDEEPLTLLAHWADYWTAHIFEDGRELTEDTACFDRTPH